LGLWRRQRQRPGWPKHSYAAGGDYEVLMKITHDAGASRGWILGDVVAVLRDRGRRVTWQLGKLDDTDSFLTVDAQYVVLRDQGDGALQR
jgi:hypothetical protein